MRRGKHTASDLAIPAFAPQGESLIHPRVALNSTHALRGWRETGILRRMASAKPSALVDTRVIYCGDNLEQLRKLPPACVDLIYIDPPFNSNRNYEVFSGETKENR